MEYTKEQRQKLANYEGGPFQKVDHSLKIGQVYRAKNGLKYVVWGLDHGRNIVYVEQFMSRNSHGTNLEHPIFIFMEWIRDNSLMLIASYDDEKYSTGDIKALC